MMNRTDLLGMTTEELKAFAVELGEKPFRGKQLFKWISRGVRDFNMMTDFSLRFRSSLCECARVGSMEIIKKQVDK